MYERKEINETLIERVGENKKITDRRKHSKITKRKNNEQKEQKAELVACDSAGAVMRKPPVKRRKKHMRYQPTNWPTNRHSGVANRVHPTEIIVKSTKSHEEWSMIRRKETDIGDITRERRKQQKNRKEKEQDRNDERKTQM